MQPLSEKKAASQRLKRREFAIARLPRPFAMHSFAILWFMASVIIGMIVYATIGARQECEPLADQKALKPSNGSKVPEDFQAVAVVQVGAPKCVKIIERL
jgi:hypothetical protein